MPGFKLIPTSTAILSVLLMTLGLASCGGGGGDSGGGDETVTGQFIDAAVGGLTYICSSGNSGVTDNNGGYTCNQGDTVTFSINDFVIGSATASGVITPNSLTSDNAQALNVAQLLQTLDVDGDPTNGISIAQYGTQYDAMAMMASANVTLSQADFDATAATYLGGPLVDEITAQTHLNDSIASLSFDAASIKAALAGKKVYPSKPTPAFSEEWVMAADGMSATGTGTDEYGAYGPGTLTFAYSDTSFTVSSVTDNPVTFSVTAITNTYVETNLGKIYYTQAEAYTDAIIAAFAGKKLYPQETSLSYSQEWAFDASGTSIVGSGVDAIGAYTGHNIVIYSGAVFTIINNDPNQSDYGTSSTFTVLDIKPNKITVTDSSMIEFGIFYSQQEAYVGL